MREMAANSGIKWVDVSFDKAVEILYMIVDITGLSYEEINVFIFGLFAIVWPIQTVMTFIFWLRRRRA
tara:strand:- start:356 stop:559 length:204 start_codon:yes stop_codon:yes gene_type:complete